MTESILTESRSGDVTTLTLNSPGTLNALSEAMIGALQEALLRIAQSSARVVILKGEGRAFCAGHDLREMQGYRAHADGGRAAYQALLSRCTQMMESIRRLPQPVIAQVHGIATAAGCQLVATCDLAIAAEETKFGVNGVNIGLFCSTPMVALSRNIPRKQAFEMLATGSFIPAERAAELGLINRAVPAATLEAEVQTMAATLAAKLPAALRIGKAAFYTQIEQPIAEAWATGSAAITENLMEPQTAEGMQAFLEKRAMPWDQS